MIYGTYKLPSGDWQEIAAWDTYVEAVGDLVYHGGGAPIVIGKSEQRVMNIIEVAECSEVGDLWEVATLASQMSAEGYDINRSTLVSAIRDGHCRCKKTASGKPMVTRQWVEDWYVSDNRRPRKKT